MVGSVIHTCRHKFSIHQIICGSPMFGARPQAAHNHSPGSHGLDILLGDKDE